MTRAEPSVRRAVRLPWWVPAVAAIGVGFVVLPLLALLLRVDWASFGALVTTEASRDAIRLSLLTSSIATAICVVLGVPIALVMARSGSAMRRVLRPIVLLPLVLPPVVAGIALLYTFGRMGLLGGILEGAGIQIAFSTVAVVLAQTFVALPYLVITLEGTLSAVGDRYEIQAATLGAGPTRTLLTVTLPLISPGLLSGAILSFARCLGEFGATLAFAGSLQGITRTLPLEIYLQRETDPDAAVALSVVLIAIAAVFVGVAGAIGRRERP